MGTEAHFEVEIARLAAMHAWAALTYQPNALSFNDACRNRDAQCSRLHEHVAILRKLRCLELDRLRAPAKCILEIDLDLCDVILAGAGEMAATRASLAERTARAEQGCEEIAEAAVVLGTERREFEPLSPVRRRTEFLARAPNRTELIVRVTRCVFFSLCDGC